MKPSNEEKKTNLFDMIQCDGVKFGELSIHADDDDYMHPSVKRALEKKFGVATFKDPETKKQVVNGTLKIVTVTWKTKFDKIRILVRNKICTKFDNSEISELKAPALLEKRIAVLLNIKELSPLGMSWVWVRSVLRK